MEPQIYQALAEAGSRYWWNQGRQYLLTRLWEKYGQGLRAGDKPVTILDIGCAAGGTLGYLSQWGEAWGLDASSQAIALCRSKGIAKGRLVLGQAERMPDFRDGQVDLVTAVEILEHVEQPRLALKEIWRVLKKDGIMILTVPADPRLWSERDERLGHYRRYRLPGLLADIRDCRFEILKASYANAFYYWPARLLLAFRRRLSAGRTPAVAQDTFETPPLVSQILTSILKLEAWFILHSRLPWGVSAVCVARKVV